MERHRAPGGLDFRDESRINGWSLEQCFRCYDPDYPQPYIMATISSSVNTSDGDHGLSSAEIEAALHVMTKRVMHTSFRTNRDLLYQFDNLALRRMIRWEATSAAVPAEHQQPTFWIPETPQRERARKTKSSVDFQTLYTWPHLPLDQVFAHMTRQQGKWHIDVAQVTLTDAVASTLNMELHNEDSTIETLLRYHLSQPV